MHDITTKYAHKPLQFSQEELDERYARVNKRKAFEEFQARCLKAMQHESDLSETP